MDSYDALKEFKKFYSDVNDSDFLHMLRKEADSEVERLKQTSPRSRPKYGDIIETAYNRIVDWFIHADEFKIDNLPSFVVSHRVSCIWAVFLGLRAANEKKLAEVQQETF